MSVRRARVAAVTATTPRLLLVDGHSLAYRAFFALPVENFSTTTGQPTNAVYGFTSMLINVLRDEQPTHIVVAFDVSRHSFRTEQVRGVQGRPQRDPDRLQGPGQPGQGGPRRAADPSGGEGGLRGRRRHRHARLPGPRPGHDGADQQRRPGRVPAGRRPDHRPLPAQGRLRPGPDGPGGDRGEVRRAAPSSYRDLAALVGETSDNLPGIPGVGPKTAAKWITTYGGVEGVIARADEIKGKAGDSLRERLADVIRNYEINCLVSDLELPLRPEDARWHRLGPGGRAPGLRHPGVPHPARPPLPVPGGGRAGGRVRVRPRPARCSPSPARWPAG